MKKSLMMNPNFFVENQVTIDKLEEKMPLNHPWFSIEFDR
jgi:hypothetical protein